LPDSTTRDDLPPEIRNALEASASKFERSYINVGHVTQTLSCDYIQETHSDDHEDCKEAVGKWLSDGRWWPDESNEWFFRFSRIANQVSTLSDAFKTCSDYLVEHVAIDALSIFADLKEIGVRHEALLKQSGIAWAEAHVMRVIRDHRPNVVEWVRKACDRPVIDPWQARLFMTMQPVGSAPYDIDRAMERLDPARSLKLAEALADKHVRKLEECIKEAAEDAYLEAAKRPKPAVKTIDATLVKGSGRPETRRSGEEFKARARKAREYVMSLPRDADVHIEINAADALECRPAAIRYTIREGKRAKLVYGGAPGTVRAGELQDLIRARFPSDSKPS
jgi:hypothetical protein